MGFVDARAGGAVAVLAGALLVAPATATMLPPFAALLSAVNVFFRRAPPWICDRRELFIETRLLLEVSLHGASGCREAYLGAPFTLR